MFGFIQRGRSIMIGGGQPEKPQGGTPRDQNGSESFRFTREFGSPGIPAMSPVWVPGSASAAQDVSAAQRGEGWSFNWGPPVAAAGGAPSSAGVHRGKQETRDGRTRPARRKKTVVEPVRPRRSASSGQRIGSDFHHRVRARIRQPGADHRGKTSASRFARFALFSFFVTFYAQKCLQRGIPRFSSQPSAFHHTTDKNGEGAPLYAPASLWHHGKRTARTGRRLAGEDSSQPPFRQDKEKAATEEALCASLEAFARSSRAAGAAALAENSDEETEADSFAQPASM